MQYLAGALMMALLFAVFVCGYMIGSKQRVKAREPDEEERKKAERLKKGFQQLMSYDTAKALESKVK